MGDNDEEITDICRKCGGSDWDRNRKKGGMFFQNGKQRVGEKVGQEGEEMRWKVPIMHILGLHDRLLLSLLYRDVMEDQVIFILQVLSNPRGKRRSNYRIMLILILIIKEAVIVIRKHLMNQKIMNEEN